MALGLTQPLKEMSTRKYSWCVKAPVRTADNLTTFMCRLSWNLWALTSWNSQGLSRPVTELLYLFIDVIKNKNVIFILKCKYQLTSKYVTHFPWCGLTVLHYAFSLWALCKGYVEIW